MKIDTIKLGSLNEVGKMESQDDLNHHLIIKDKVSTVTVIDGGVKVVTIV